MQDRSGLIQSERIRFYAAAAKVKTGAGWEHATIPFPETFSFIEAPDRALRVMRDFVALLGGGATRFWMDQSGVRLQDLCAATVLNIIALSAREGTEVRLAGRFPKNREAAEIVAATGLPKAIDANVPRLPAFHPYALVWGRRTPDRATRSSQAEVEAGKLTSYVDERLQRSGFALTDSAKEYLSALVGEVITNAEDHAGRNEWWVAGYTRLPPGDTVADCHLTIVNFGRPIAESLRKLPPESSLRAEIEALVRLHTQRRAWRAAKWTEENLWTVYALQQGVSVKSADAQDSSVGHWGRGQGTVTLIEMFRALGASKRPGYIPKMAIVSGRTHILFDGKYTMREERLASGETRKLIAFNEANDLSLPPDAEYVRNLRTPFPGTLVSLRFFIDPDHLAELAHVNA